MKIVAVLPAFCEEKRVFAAVQDAARFVDAVVVVDDASVDATGDEALRGGAHVLRHIVNRGQGAAIQTGVDFALQELGADIVVHFDADGQMSGADIPAMIDPIVRGEADIVLGSRFLEKEARNMPLARRLTLKASILFTAAISGVVLSDTHNGFRAMSRAAAEQLRITLDRMAHASEILDAMNILKLRWREQAVTISYSESTLEKGQSFMSGFAILKDLAKHKFFDEL